MLSFLKKSVVTATYLPKNLAPYFPATESFHIEDAYIVQLYPNHTLEAHFTHIGIQPSSFAPKGNFGLLTAINAYAARLDQAQIHNLIRADPGVKYVRHQYRFAPIVHNVTDAVPVEAPAKRERLSRRWDLVTSPNELPYPFSMTSKPKLFVTPPWDTAVSTHDCVALQSS